MAKRCAITARPDAQTGAKRYNRIAKAGHKPRANRPNRNARLDARIEAKRPARVASPTRKPRANRPNRNARPDARIEAKRCDRNARPDARTEVKRYNRIAKAGHKPRAKRAITARPDAQTEAKRAFSLVQPLKGVRRGGAASRFDSLAQTGAAARQDNTVRAVCQKAPRQIFPHCPASHGKAIECAGAANLHSPSFPRRVDKETESMRKADEPRIYARSSVMNDTKTAPPPSQ